MSRKLRGLFSAALSLGGAFVCASGPAQAAGFYLQEQSARGVGRAFAGEAADTGPASLWWNPAAIGFSEREVYGGLHAILVDSEVTDAGSTVTRPTPGGPVTLPVGGFPRAFDPILNGLAPNFAAATPLGEDFALGLSVTAPFNFTTKYDFRSWARYEAVKSRLNTADIQITGAWTPTDSISVALAADAQYADATLTTALPNLLQPASGGGFVVPGDGYTVLSGDGWEWGWSVGVQGRVGDLDLGASYRSSIDHELEGTASVAGLAGPLAPINAVKDARAGFSTPWIATVAARWAVTDRATVGLQVQQIGWGEFDVITIDLGTAREVLVQDYDDTTNVSLGVDYAVRDGVIARAGLQYDPTPTPDADRSPRVPDGDRWFLGVGGGFAPRENLLVDVSAAYVIFEDSTIDRTAEPYGGTPAATTVDTVGDVEGASVVLSLGGRWRF